MPDIAMYALQRVSCMKGGHLFVLSPHSIFWKKQANVTFFQKAAYCVGPIAHAVNFWAEPIMFSLPFLCLGCNICAFGLDEILFATHVAVVGTSLLHSSYGHTWNVVLAGVTSRSAARIQWFTGFKAIMNTIMVLSGYKRPPRFKVTPKAVKAPFAETTAASQEKEGSSTFTIQLQPPAGHARSMAPQDNGTIDHPTAQQSGYKVHAALSRVTNLRKHVMPMDGTLDAWVLLTITAADVFAIAMGLRRLWLAGSFTAWTNVGAVNVLWLGIAYALVDAVPGLLFMMYIVVWERVPWVMSLWAPFVVCCAVIGATAVELRLAVGYILHI
jgi:hypothetical protein